MAAGDGPNGERLLERLLVHDSRRRPLPRRPRPGRAPAAPRATPARRRRGARRASPRDRHRLRLLRPAHRHRPHRRRRGLRDRAGVRHHRRRAPGAHPPDREAAVQPAGAGVRRQDRAHCRAVAARRRHPSRGPRPGATRAHPRPADRARGGAAAGAPPAAHAPARPARRPADTAQLPHRSAGRHHGHGRPPPAELRHHLLPGQTGGALPRCPHPSRRRDPAGPTPALPPPRAAVRRPVGRGPDAGRAHRQLRCRCPRTASSSTRATRATSCT